MEEVVAINGGKLGNFFKNKLVSEMKLIK